MQLRDILNHLQQLGVKVDLIGSDAGEIQQVAGLNGANAQQISFLNDKKYLSFLEKTKAGAVILESTYQENAKVPVLVVENPYYVYALVAQFLNPIKNNTCQYHLNASIDASACLESDVTIMAQAVIQADVSIKTGSVIGCGAVIEESVTIGQNCFIGANVVIRHACVIGDNVTVEAGAIIGGDGFGWANHEGKWIKIPQIGRVVIGNDVSIGNNVCIDRGAIEDTIIEDNCIIDNMVHIAHNVKIGQGSAIAGQTGFAGSTTLGEYCTVAGQVGFSGHITIADNSHFLAKAGVTHSIKKSGVYSGFPAIPVSEWQKNSIRARHLDKMAKQIKALQKQVEQLVIEGSSN
ncbi:UDP-3-O-[3-hydroxymyristoyl] glucosamine N-acyltransferase [hydrothermal vent metagenome]|uniref:UDP-3-O-[3-hydroxymyristoyl] glucosamine N-acyltransferase n=1 Tax=hydrothermal vent metagenome TaxID=652676 RepID=A0A3B0W0J5_9ZZZZ